MRSILIYPSLDLDTAVSVQPVPKTAYRSDFREKQNCLQRAFDHGTSYTADKRATTRLPET